VEGGDDIGALDGISDLGKHVQHSANFAGQSCIEVGETCV
jgi:hypothetical protein